LRTVQLDEATVSMLADLDAEKIKAIQQAALPYNLQAHAVVQVFMRQQKLEGNWKLSKDNKSITSEDQPNIAQRQTRKKK
jgi:hypothetical protein